MSPLRVTVAAGAALLPSPVLVGSAKSAALAPGLASLKVATVTVALRLPSVAVNPAPLLAVSAASAMVAAELALAVAPGRASRRAVAVYAAAAASVWVPVMREVPVLGAT